MSLFAEYIRNFERSEELSLEDYLKSRDESQTFEGLSGGFVLASSEKFRGRFVCLLLEVEKPLSEKHVLLLWDNGGNWELIEDLGQVFISRKDGEGSELADCPAPEELLPLLKPVLMSIREKAELWLQGELNQLNGYIREVHQELQARRQSAWQQSWWLERDRQLREEEEELMGEIEEQTRLLKERSSLQWSVKIPFWGVLQGG